MGNEVAPRKKRLRPPPDRYRAFVEGGMDFTELDDEEIMRGQLRSKNGSFQGQPPKSIPREFYQGLQAEQHRRFNSEVPAMVRMAMDTMIEIMRSPVPSANDAARAQVARYWIDRFAGKTPDNVQLKAEVTSRWDDVQKGILIDVEEDDDE